MNLENMSDNRGKEEPSPEVLRRMRQVAGGRPQATKTGTGPRSPSGVPGLDEMLGGGFPHGRTILVSGDPGAGKTILCSQFLANGIEKSGENGLYVSFDENETAHAREMKEFGWDFQAYETQGKFAFIDASPIRTIPGEIRVGTLSLGRKDFSLIGLLEVIRNNAKAIDARRIVVDPVSTLISIYLNESESRKGLVDLAQVLADTGATSLLVADSYGGIDHSIGSSMPDFITQLDRFPLNNWIAFLNPFVQGILKMRSFSGPTRTLTVVKMRETPIDQQPRPYVIRENGIQIHPRESVV